MSSTNLDEAETNPFLARRAAKIARNEERLRSLGLFTPKLVAEKQTRRCSLHVAGKSHQSPPVVPLRRSKRLRQQDTTDHLDDQTPTTCNRTRQKSKSTDAENENEVSEHPMLKKRKDTQQRTPAPRNSARGIELCVQRLLFGSNGLLGKQLDKTGKAFCMEESAHLAALSGCDKPVGTISFNKYSGVQEWANDVLFLWVNLNAPQAEVVNEFPQDGRQITWFGGSRMHEQTPVIQRLLRVGTQQQQQQQGVDHSQANSTGIVLWCRLYVPDKKTFTPYQCLGRLSYSSHEPGSRPLRFVWNLMDFDALAEHLNTDVREAFHATISSAER